jgi:hypothetical protein
LAELGDAHIEPQRLVVKEAAGARSTNGVHAKVSNYPVSDNDNLTVLSPDFDYSLHLWDVEKGSHSVGGDLIFHQVGTEDNASQIASAPGGSDAADISIAGKLLLYLF